MRIKVAKVHKGDTIITARGDRFEVTRTRRLGEFAGIELKGFETLTLSREAFVTVIR